jgi:hypothetical protein
MQRCRNSSRPAPFLSRRGAGERRDTQGKLRQERNLCRNRGRVNPSPVGAAYSCSC